MTAATQERNTPTRDNVDYVFPVAASKKILAGTLVMLDTSGNAEPGATATGKTAAGIAQETIDNTGGGAGDVEVKVRRGTYLLANSASSDEITDADWGATCYVVDNQTVAKTHDTNTRSAAGTVRGVTPAGVWVEI